MEKTVGKILRQDALGGNVFSMEIEAPEVASQAGAGQFVNVYTKDASKLLPRPISLCGFDADKGTIRLVYRVTGKGTGTEEFSSLGAGDRISLVGPLGNGFPLLNGTPLLIGGGIGIPPMLALGKNFYERTGRRVRFVLGYRGLPLFLKEEFEPYGDVFVSTDDGSGGTHGTVIDAVKENGLSADILYACGPVPMLRGVKALSQEWGITAYLSMEGRMACGVGACLACVCKTTKTDAHSKVKNARVCVDGPVFKAEEVDLS